MLRSLLEKDSNYTATVDEWSDGLIVLSGQSGVGKSTFLNSYQPQLKLETNDISKSLNRVNILQDMSNYTIEKVVTSLIHRGLVR